MSVYDAESRAQRVAERAVEAWSGIRGMSDTDYAIGVLAALCLTDHGPRSDDPAKLLLAADDQFIARLLSEIWSGFWILRPELGRLTGPIAGWVNDDPPGKDLVHALAHTARTAVKVGLLDLVYGGGLADTDLLGKVYTETRPKSTRDARGEFYSPANLCQMMAAMIMPDIKPGQSIAEPAAGTGGMLRAAAQVIRRQGMNPGDFWWVANDVSHTAVACLAVNCHVWDLGPRVVIGIADSLAEPGWPERAWREQQEVTRQRDEQMKLARSLAMFRHVLSGEALGPDPAPIAQALPPAPVPVPVPVFDPTAPMIQLSLFDGDSEAA